MEKIPLIALCGFLGSGKTTLMRRWWRNEDLKDAAYIVHDLSDTGFDATLLSYNEKTPEAGSLHGRVAALHGEHANEKLHASLQTALEDISQLNPTPSMVLSESTGAARPWPLIQALTQNDHFYLRHFIVTVDALNLHRDFQDGLALTREEKTSPDDPLNHAVNILAEQMAFASIIVLTKIDTLPKSIVETQVNHLKRLKPNVTIALSAQAGLLLTQLEQTSAPDLAILTKLAQKCGISESASVTEQVEVSILNEARPFHPQRLYEACQSHLGLGLYRTKGFLWLASRPGDVLLWQQAGSQIFLELRGQWRAEAVKNIDQALLPEEVEGLQRMLEGKDPVFGDRSNELTLIGLERDRLAFLSVLKEALCTDQEVAAWRSGMTFDDPWPKTLKKND